MILFLEIYMHAYRHLCMVRLSWVVRCDVTGHFLSFYLPTFFKAVYWMYLRHRLESYSKKHKEMFLINSL